MLVLEIQFSYRASQSAPCAECDRKSNNLKMPPKKKAAAAAPSQEEDVSMAEGSPAPADVPEPENDIELDEQRIRIVSFAISVSFYVTHPN